MHCIKTHTHKSKITKSNNVINFAEYCIYAELTATSVNVNIVIPLVVLFLEERGCSTYCKHLLDAQ